MNHETVTIAPRAGFDWKGVGYLFSIAGALLLGAIAWPRAGEPAWYGPALVAGMAATIIGFFVRYLAHLKEMRQLRRAQAEAERRD